MDRRTLLTLGGLGGAVVVLALVFGKTPKAAAETRVPTDDAEVLETLPIAASDPTSRQVAALRRELATRPNDLALAVRLARLDIQLNRERSDPRYLGHAQAALAPWWNAPDAPVDALVLRAIIKQSLHDFEPALVDLDRALALAPDHAQAWITRATVLMVRGRFEEARASCGKLTGIASRLAQAVCVAQVDALTGDARGAHDRLVASMERGASAAEAGWAASSLGEFAERYGDVELAASHFQRALSVDANDAYTRAALADLEIDRRAYERAIALLAGQEANDGLLLRLAIAERRAGKPEARGHVEVLAARIEASRLRGDVVHRREEARYWLELGGDPARALALAKDNWDVQKEPWDARILLEAAKGAREPKEAAPVLAWLERTKLEHPALAALAKELK